MFIENPVHRYLYKHHFGAWGLNLGFHTCKTSALLLEPHLQSILFCLFWRWGPLKLFLWAGLKLWSSWSQPPCNLARIAGVSHQLLGWMLFMIIKNWKKFKCPPIDEWVNIVYSVYKMDSYSDIKRTVNMYNMNLKCIMLN
jgi:hypothetical protein